MERAEVARNLMVNNVKLWNDFEDKETDLEDGFQSFSQDKLGVYEERLKENQKKRVMSNNRMEVVSLNTDHFYKL